MLSVSCAKLKCDVMFGNAILRPVFDIQQPKTPKEQAISPLDCHKSTTEEPLLSCQHNLFV